MFALVFQGINGLIQVEAFFALHGPEYLSFSAAYLLGTVLSMLFVMNFENSILAGRWTATVRRYFIAVWLLGLLAAGTALAWRVAVPSFLVFCCFGICSRIFLAWANHARPAATSLLLAAMLVLLASLVSSLAMVMLAAMLAFPLAAWRATGPELAADGGSIPVLRDSLLAFTKYLPHTLSGLAIGYVDRFVALNIVGGAEAELYLRTVQVCSWAAFVAYPVVFQARARVLQQGSLTLASALRTAAFLAGVMIIAGALIVTVAHLTGRMPVLSPFVLTTVFLAIIFSQCYQVASSLNFVNDRFGTVNRITLSSAALVLLLAFTLVPAWKAADALALVLLSGWLLQFSLTAAFLYRQQR